MTRATVEADGVAYEVAVDRKAGTVTVDGQAFPVAVEPNSSSLLVRVGGHALHVHLQGDRATIEGTPVAWRIADVAGGPGAAGGAGHGAAKVKPPMNGKLERLLVQPGQAVAKGDILFVLEAMKMQNEVRSPVAGRVSAVHGTAGAAVEPSQVVVEIEPA